MQARKSWTGMHAPTRPSAAAKINGRSGFRFTHRFSRASYSRGRRGARTGRWVEASARRSEYLLDRIKRRVADLPPLDAGFASKISSRRESSPRRRRRRPRSCSRARASRRPSRAAPRACRAAVLRSSRPQHRQNRFKTTPCLSSLSLSHSTATALTSRVAATSAGGALPAYSPSATQPSCGGACGGAFALKMPAPDGASIHQQPSARLW